MPARWPASPVSYYARLEQGRAGSPSLDVIESLARTLQLDLAEREHVVGLLARPTPSRRSSAGPQRVRPGLHLMLHTLDHVPAFILGRRTDVLAANRLAREVLTDFDTLPAPATRPCSLLPARPGSPGPRGGLGAGRC
ncbi:MmyB family transcriptional regulator [Streptomyces buecherae]|uniref:MmyB family transcriptional regulator n=1 Tax=Streptomyces buecherae TaxID=2763006 RepID=UPI0037A49A38